MFLRITTFGKRVTDRSIASCRTVVGVFAAARGARRTTSRGGFILECQFVNLHGFVQFASFDLNVSQHIEQNDEGGMLSSQQLDPDSVGNGIHFQGTDQFSSIFVFDTHFDNVGRIVVRTQYIVRMIQGLHCLGVDGMILRIICLLEQLQGFDITLDGIFVAKMNVLGSSCLVE